jgi:ATP-binding cassette subfamily B protein
MRILRESKHFWPHIFALAAISLLDTPLTLLNPLPLKIVVDSVLGTHPLPSWLTWLFPEGTKRTDVLVILVVSGLLVIIELIKQCVEISFLVLRGYTCAKLLLSFRAKLFRHSQRLSLAYHDAIGTSDSIYRIQHDAPAIQWITVDAFIPFVSSLVMLVAMIFVILRIDWLLAIVALGIVPVLYIVSQIYSRRLNLRWRKAKNLESSMLSIVQEVLSSVRVVKAFVQEDREEERYIASGGKNLQQQTKLALINGIFGLIVGVAMALGTATVLFLAVNHVQAGRLTLGELILVLSYLAMLYSPLRTLSNSAASLQGSLVSAERAFALLDEAPEVPEKLQARQLIRAVGGVTYKNVSFSYNEGRPALRNISFDIAPGARVGISGTSGAGKSTLVSLMIRLYDPGEGSILLDGIDIRDFKLQDLRNQFAIVQQEPVLFSSTLAENIAYARPDATEVEIIAAAKAANADDFVSRLPQGYKTEVGERGIQLSGGERQRISLARAFLKDAPVLILDEPTSSVDMKTESSIMEAMQRLMRGRTTFMIAHRLQTLDTCDMRLQLERGQLAPTT